MTRTAGSLFSGVGGLDLAAEQLGFEVAWQVEADPWRQQVLAARWPSVPRHGDIKEVGARDLAPVDLLVAGSPGSPPHQWEPPRTVRARSVPNRAKRVSALGDSVVPQCAALALHLLGAGMAEATAGAGKVGGAR